MARLRGFVIVTTEVKDAILNYEYDPVNHPEQIADVYFPYTADDLDANGLPKDDLTPAAPTYVMFSPFEKMQVVPQELNDGRWMVSKEALRNLWDYMLKPHDEGGLKIGSPVRSVIPRSDFFVAQEGDALNYIILSEKKPDPIEE